VTLDEAREHIGNGVVYDPGYGLKEDGVITSVKDPYVFVRYRGDQHSKATIPADLTPLFSSPSSTSTSDRSPESTESAAGES
jgi:hypothetical protein